MNRQTKPADDPTSTGLAETAADDPAGTGLAAKQQPADDVGRPLAVRCRLVEGVQWCWPLRRRAQTYPTCLPPTYRLCPSPYLPTPLIFQTQFRPNLFFCYFYFYSCFPTINRPLTPFIVTVRLTYRSPRLLPTPTFPTQRGLREG